TDFDECQQRTVNGPTPTIRPLRTERMGSTKPRRAEDRARVTSIRAGSRAQGLRRRTEPRPKERFR
ncbi:MAG TPA: hypothetical protein PKA84_17495, partial [Rubrivivax sp.]|nr:hypothetical protein [Rubrivivax sp.]